MVDVVVVDGAVVDVVDAAIVLLVGVEVVGADGDVVGGALSPPLETASASAARPSEEMPFPLSMEALHALPTKTSPASTWKSRRTRMPDHANEGEGRSVPTMRAST